MAYAVEDRMYEMSDHEKAEMKHAYYLLAAVGIGYLFAFAALTQPVDYWHHLFPSFNIEFSISTLYVWVNLMVLGVIVLFGGDPIIKSRMNIGFYGQFVVLIILPTSWFLNLGGFWNYWLVLGCTGSVAVVTAFTASSAIALTSQYPPQVQAGYQLGVGLSTLLGSIFRILTKLMVPDTMVVTSSLIYFYTSAAAVAACIFAYKTLTHLDISKRHVTYGLDPSSQLRMQSMMTPVCSYDALAFLEHSAEECMEVISSAESSPDRGHCDLYEFEFCDIRTRSASDGPLSNMNVGALSETTHLVPVVLKENVELSKIRILWKVVPPLSSVFLIFCSTLLLWPSIITDISSFNFPYLEKTKWWPLILMFMFALFDCIGRFVVDYRRYVTKDTIWIFALMRLCLIPPLICCAKGWSVFTSDAWSISLVCTLGISNGYLGSIAIILVNDYTQTKEEAGIAGVFTGFIINAALATGATLSLYLHNSLLK